MNKHIHKVKELSIVFSISICVVSMALDKFSNRSQNQKAVFSDVGASSFSVG